MAISFVRSAMLMKKLASIFLSIACVLNLSGLIVSGAWS